MAPSDVGLGLKDAGAGMADSRKFVEVLPIDDTFVTTLGEIEFPEPGMVRFYLYAKEGDRHVLKLRVLWPLAKALDVNRKARERMAEEFRKLNSVRLVCRH